MKNKIKIIGFIALIAVIGFSFSTCEEEVTPQTVTYTGINNGVTYTLKITEKTNRSVYSPKSGDSYKLSVSSISNNTYSGTVNNFAGGIFTLTSLSNKLSTFTVTVSETGITNITGNVYSDNGGGYFVGPGAMSGL